MNVPSCRLRVTGTKGAIPWDGHFSLQVPALLFHKLKLSAWEDTEPPSASSPFLSHHSIHSCDVLPRWFRDPMTEDQYLSSCHLSSNLLVFSSPQKPPLDFKVHRSGATLESTRHLHILPFCCRDISGKFSEFCCKTNAWCIGILLSAHYLFSRFILTFSLFLLISPFSYPLSVSIPFFQFPHTLSAPALLKLKWVFSSLCTNLSSSHSKFCSREMLQTSLLARMG